MKREEFILKLKEELELESEIDFTTELKELEEWKYYSSLDPFHGTDRNSNGTFNPDPLLFPATWLPLRWLQIFALAPP